MALFRRTSKVSTPEPLPTTGDPADDELLRHIAAASDLANPRHWVHYLFFQDEADARTAAEVIVAAGWHIQGVDESAGKTGPEWMVVADQDDVVTSPDVIREAREFFQAVAATNGGGTYDGWEASV